MAAPKIVRHPTAILRTKCDPVVDFGQGFQDDVAAATEALQSSNNGAALAAPQIGISRRFFVVSPGIIGLPMIIVNPTILWRSAEETSVLEGCLSFPGVWIEVKRAHQVRASWDDAAGHRHEQLLEAFAARVFQHESDHLDGILFVDRLDKKKKFEVLKNYFSRK